MAIRNSYIRSVGRYLPERRLTNADIEKLVDTNDEWILSRTGIKERRILEPGLGNSYMGQPSGSGVLERAGVDGGEVDAVIVGTVTPDMMFPATACLGSEGDRGESGLGVRSLRGLFGIPLFPDDRGADDRIRAVQESAGDRKRCDEHHRRLYGPQYMCIVRGWRGCGASGGISRGRLRYPGLYPAYRRLGRGPPAHESRGSKRPASLETVQNREHFVCQEGRQVFKSAVKEMAAVSGEILEKNGLTGKDVALFIPHQANLRIIDACANRMGIDAGKVVINIEKYANTTGGHHTPLPLRCAGGTGEGETRGLHGDVGLRSRVYLGQHPDPLVRSRSMNPNGGGWTSGLSPTVRKPKNPRVLSSCSHRASVSLWNSVNCSAVILRNRPWSRTYSSTGRLRPVLAMFRLLPVSRRTPFSIS